MVAPSSIMLTQAEARGLPADDDYDIVLLDLMLPTSKASRWCGGGGPQHTPVLILSGLSRPQAKVKGLALRADNFITKPFDKRPNCSPECRPSLRIGALQAQSGQSRCWSMANSPPDRGDAILELSQCCARGWC